MADSLHLKRAKAMHRAHLQEHGWIDPPADQWDKLSVAAQRTYMSKTRRK